MNTQFKKGIIELCVLKMISFKDMYGFELITNISKEIEVNENTIYPILRRLTQQGYFETYKEVVSVGAPRKYYKLTTKGQEKLNSDETDWNAFISNVSNILKGEFL